MKTTIRALALGLLLGAFGAQAAYTPPNPNGQATMASSTPVVIASNQSTLNVLGPLTNTELRALAVPVSGTFWQATQPVSGTFFQATQPVSIAATVAVSGPLTDTQLRASAVPTSLASVPTHAVTQSGSWTVTGAGGTFPVTGAVPANTTTSGTLSASDAVVAAPIGDGTLVTGASTAGSVVAAVVPDGFQAWTLLIKGYVSGTIYTEASNNSTNGTDGDWVEVKGRRTGTAPGTESVLYAMVANGYYRGNGAGFKYLRARLIGGTGPTIQWQLSNGMGATFLNSGIPAGSSTIGNVGGTGTAGVSATAVMTVQGIASGTAIPVSGAFFQATQPISGAVTLASTTITGTVAATQSGTWNVGSITTLPALVASTANIGKVASTQFDATADTTMQTAAVAVGNGTVLTVTGYGTASIQITGTFVGTITFEGTEDGTNYVSVAATQLGASSIASTATVPGIYRLAVTGLTNIRARISAYISGSITAIGRATNAPFASKFVQLVPGTNKIGTVDIATAAASAKGTQGANGVPTQDLKDAGRNPVMCYTNIPVLALATDTLQTLTCTKAGATVTATTTPAVVTAAKTFRMTRVSAAYIATTASGYGLVRLRFNTAGVVAVTSPIAVTLIVGSGSPVTANATDTTEAAIPDGWEFAAATGVGVSVQGIAAGVGTAVGYVMVSYTGFEY